MADKQKNTAFYLKYRPQSLADLIGQTSIKNIISAAFLNNKLSHAYLLVGPRGTGKTSTARILAKMVNCSAKGNIPCNVCDNCISITDGSNLDLIEIDAASNRGIEDIRFLREKIKLSPTAAQKKVYIIDEVHMLTQEAFNALLKTLEEPPSHVLFILATTDVSKLPQTILSRVQRLDFNLASPEELLEALKKIVGQEKIQIDEQALKLLIKRSDGSFRDGVKLLDQIASIGGKITIKQIEESLKSSSFEDTLEILQNLSDKNASLGLLNILSQINRGVDIKEFTLSLMDVLRNLVFMKAGLGESLVKPHLLEEKYQDLLKLSEKFTNQDLIKILNILQNSLEKLKFTSIPSLPLELAVVEICDTDTPTLPAGPLRPPLARLRRGASRQVSSDLSGAPNPSGSSDILKLKEKWTYVCETIRSYNFSLEALLRSINIRKVTEGTVIIEVPYSFHQRILESPKNRDLLESVLSDVLGRAIRISTVLGVRPERKEDIANIEVAADDEIIRVAAEIFNSDSIN